MLKNYNYKENNILKELLFFLILLIFILIVLNLGNKVLAFHPCDCTKDRIIKITEPLMEGNDILSLQKRLLELDYYNGEIDGIYGTLSVKAVNNFKNDYILEPDGVVDVKTWDMLANLNEAILTSHRRKQPSGELSIIINLYSRQLSLLSNGKVYRTYPVTIGKKKSPSPVGEWYIKNKYERIDGGPLGSRWMGLNVPWGVYGIHGTNKPWEVGVAASQGCIRLHNEYVEELFDWVKEETPVKIIGPMPEVIIDKILKEGSNGYDVMAVQEKLREQRFYKNSLDGTYTSEMIKSIRELESQFQLKVDGITDENILNLLELKYEFKPY